MSLQTLKVLAEMLKNPTAEHYGLEIAKGTGLPSGSLYPILLRLEQHGWLTSDWEDIDPVAEGRRKRRYYRFTSDGLRQARQEVEGTVTELKVGLGGLAHG